MVQKGLDSSCAESAERSTYVLFSDALPPGQNEDCGISHPIGSGTEKLNETVLTLPFGPCLVLIDSRDSNVEEYEIVE